MERVRPRILSAASEPLLFETRNRVLEMAGFEVVGCLRGLGAREQFGSGKFDAVVLGCFQDLQIRRTLIADFKRLKPAVPVVVLCHVDDPQETFEQADEVMDSLSGPEKLVSTVRGLLRFRAEPEKPDDNAATISGD